MKGLNNRGNHFNIYLSIYKLLECHFQRFMCSLTLVPIWKNAVIGKNFRLFRREKFSSFFPDEIFTEKVFV